jgi:hypothetical protein
MSADAGSGRFSALLLEGLDHYRKGRMMEAVRAWEEAYLLEPTNLRAREFLRSALERIHAHMGADGQAAQPAEPVKPPSHPWLPKVDKTPSQPPAAPAQQATAPAQHAAAQPTPSRPPPAAPQPLSHVTVRPPAPEQATARPTFMEPPTDSPKAPLRPSDRSPWDDGPSRAIEQPEDPGDEASGAWSIHKEALPVEALADDETEVWMRGARELVALNDFSGALELLGKILIRKPNDRDALSMHELCEHNLTLMYESKLGAMEARPSVAIAPDEIIWLSLDPRAGFVLAQIDGEVSFEDLYAICGLKRLDTARILCELLEQGVVSVAGQERAVAKRAMHRS